MPSIKGRLSSDPNEWATPADVFQPLSREFFFVLDCAAAKWNAKAEDYLSKEDDALTVDWAKRAEKSVGLSWDPAPAAWLNPPYGRAKDEEGRPVGKALLDPFVRKAYAESRKGLTVVVLCFARPDTALWEDVIMRADEVRFIRSRVKFHKEDGTTGPAPAPSCLVIFRPESQGPPKFSVWHRDGCKCSKCKGKKDNERTKPIPARRTSLRPSPPIH